MGQFYTVDNNGNITFSGYLTQDGSAAPAVSPAGEGRFYFDSTSNQFLVSQNGSAYVPFGSGSGHTIQDEGSPLTQRTNLNFVGTGVTVTDGGAGPNSTVVTIPGAAAPDPYNRDEFVATSGQTVFGSFSFSYAIGMDELLVFSDGVLMKEGGSFDYTETSTTSITFNTGRPTGSFVTVYRSPATSGALGVATLQSFGNPTLTGAVVLTAGTNVTLGQVGQTITINSSASGGHTIQEEGSPLTQRTNLNFVGTGVTVTDGGAGPNSTIVTISSGGGSPTVLNESRQDFVATGGQTSFGTLSPVFVPGGVDAQVYKNGRLMRFGGSFDYTETSNDTIVFNTGLVAGDLVSVVINSVTSGSGVSGSGTLNKLAKWTPDSITLGDSIVSESGAVLTVAGNILPEANGTRALGSASFRFTDLFLASNINYSSDLIYRDSGTERARLTSAGTFFLGTGSPNAAVLLQMDSTTKGLLPPRMTTAQRDAIASPPAGLVIYNTDTSVLNIFV